MGDRCWMEVTVPREDQHDKVEALELFEQEHQGTFSAGEVNYGGDKELRALVAAGIEFYGYHGAGDNYPEEVFASDPSEEHGWVAAQGDGEEPRVRIRADGFDQGDLDTAKRYLDRLAHLKSLESDTGGDGSRDPGYDQDDPRGDRDEDEEAEGEIKEKLTISYGSTVVHHTYAANDEPGPIERLQGPGPHLVMSGDFLEWLNKGKGGPDGA